MITSFSGQKSRKKREDISFCLLIKLGLTFNSVVDALWFKGCENNSVLKSYNGGPWKTLKGLRLHLKARTRHKTHANNRRIATFERTATTLKRDYCISRSFPLGFQRKSWLAVKGWHCALLFQSNYYWFESIVYMTSPWNYDTDHTVSKPNFKHACVFDAATFRRKKTCLRGFHQSGFQTSLLSYRD